MDTFKLFAMFIKIEWLKNKNFRESISAFMFNNTVCKINFV